MAARRFRGDYVWTRVLGSRVAGAGAALGILSTCAVDGTTLNLPSKGTWAGPPPSAHIHCA
jgi:hypothetical protein